MDGIEDESFDRDEIMRQWEAKAAEREAEKETVTPEQLADPNEWDNLTDGN